MRGFVTVILFFLFALAFARTEYVDAVPAALMTVCTVQNTDTTPQDSINEDSVIPMDSNKGIADMEFGDAHTLAHRVSASAERMYRFSSIETTQFIKTLLRKMAARMASLASCHTHVFFSTLHIYHLTSALPALQMVLLRDRYVICQAYVHTSHKVLHIQAK